MYFSSLEVQIRTNYSVPGRIDATDVVGIAIRVKVSSGGADRHC